MSSENRVSIPLSVSKVSLPNASNILKRLISVTKTNASNFICSLQDIVIETILGGKNSVQGPLLLKLLIIGLKIYLHLLPITGNIGKQVRMGCEC